MYAAALTGDLISSRSATPEAVDDSMAALQNAAAALGAVADFDPRFTRHRGDGWQVAMPLPGSLLDLVLILIAGLTSAKTGLATRIGIGVGPVDHLGTKDLSDATGEAFITSGDMLDFQDQWTGQRMSIAGSNEESWMHSTLHMADWISQGWTPGQAQAVLTSLSHPGRTNAEHADALSISRQSYERRIRGSGLPAMEEAREQFVMHDWDTG